MLAVPATPYPVKVTQPDGSELTVRLNGDEFYHFYTTDDGYTVFDVYLVSENYIYQAELKFLTEKSSDYSMYCSYLENSFASEEGAQG